MADEPLLAQSYEIANDKAFQDVLKKAEISVSDFRPVFGAIAKAFYKENRAIFALKSQGKYPDFGGFKPFTRIRYQGEWMTRRDAYRLQKIRKVGFAYPLLLREGDLARSLTRPSDPQAIKEITKETMILGSNVEYFKYHQSDAPRKKIPLRKPLFLDDKDDPIGAAGPRRLQRWKDIVETFVSDKLKEV